MFSKIFVVQFYYFYFYYELKKIYMIILNSISLNKTFKCKIPNYIFICKHLKYLKCNNKLLLIINILNTYSFFFIYIFRALDYYLVHYQDL